MTSTLAPKWIPHLSDSYERYPTNAESNAFFSDVAHRVFAKLTDTSWKPMAMLKALEQSAQDQRINLNFSDPTAEALAAQFHLDGALLPSTAQRTQLGMYPDDASVGKLEYWLTTSVNLQCAVAAREVTETLTPHNSILNSIHSPYTLGERNVALGLPRTTMLIDVVAFAPPGAHIVSMTPAHSAVTDWARSGTEKGNTGLSRTVFVPQGQMVTVSRTPSSSRHEAATAAVASHAHRTRDEGHRGTGLRGAVPEALIGGRSCWRAPRLLMVRPESERCCRRLLGRTP